MLRKVIFTTESDGWLLSATHDGSQWNSLVYHSTDGGDTWSAVYSVVDCRLMDMAVTAARTAHVVGFDGRLLSTSNGGQSWTEQMAGLSGSLVGVTFTDSLHGWIVGEGVFNTSDGGESWIQKDDVSHPLLFKACFLNPQVGWVVGDRGTILHTTDGGLSWEDQSYSTSYGLNGVCFRNETDGWAVGGGGLMLHYSYPDGISPDADIAVPDEFHLTAFPNPFNAQTTLTLDVPASVPLSVVIYDVTGRAVETLFEGTIPAGLHTQIFDASRLSSGVYFARLTGSKFSQTHKLILVR